MANDRQHPLDDYYDEVIVPTWNAWKKCETHDDHHTNAVLGLVGEAGEVADIYKKMWFHKDKPGYLNELLLEMGDVMYYWNKIRKLNGWDVETILDANKTKLFERYNAR